jgi:hypothetical protein
MATADSMVEGPSRCATFLAYGKSQKGASISELFDDVSTREPSANVHAPLYRLFLGRGAARLGG